MSISTEQLAELLAGIARSQQAIIDAIESETGGWRSTHLLPKLNTAANMRIAQVRLLDLPSRILLRSQSRVPMDADTIARDLALAFGAPDDSPRVPVAPSKAAASVPPAAAVAVAATAAAVAAAAPGAPGEPGSDEELNFFDN